MEWVTKITTVGLEMALPAIGGAYLDQRLRSTYWALIGLVFGVVVGMWHLLQMTRPSGKNREDKDRNRGSSSE
jgi:hypothetical protein